MKVPKSKLLSGVMRRMMSVVGLLAFFSLFINLLRLTMPVYMLQVIDRVVSSESIETLIFITIIAVGALIVSGLLTAISKAIQSRMSIWFEKTLYDPAVRASIAGRITNQSMGVGVVRDLGELRRFFSGPVLVSLFEFPWTPIFIGVIYYLHPWLGIFSAVMAVIMFLLALLNDLMVNKQQEEAMSHSMSANRQVEHSLKNFDSVRSMGMISRLARRALSFTTSGLKLQGKVDERNGHIASMTRFVRSVAQVGILGLGAYVVLRGEATTGGMIAASILQSVGFSPIDQSVNSVRAVKSVKKAYGRVSRQLGAIDLSTDELPMDGAPALSLSLKQAMYMPQGAGKPILRPMRFELGAGERLGILGPSASGKSTLSRLLAGILPPTSGSVLINELDASRLSGETFGHLVGYLGQEPELMAGTIADNISRFADATESDRSAKVVEAAQRAGVHETILNLPKRYETQLDADGLAALSRSQLQLIGLARAYYGSPRLLVLDEPATFLDIASIATFEKTIDELQETGCTIVLISQRQQFLKACDKLLLLRDGVVADFGPSQTVLDNLRKGAPTPKRPGNLMNPRLIEGGQNRKDAG